MKHFHLIVGVIINVAIVLFIIFLPAISAQGTDKRQITRVQSYNEEGLTVTVLNINGQCVAAIRSSFNGSAIGVGAVPINCPWNAR